jgi:CRP/FNR family transcriptional regulator, cyclic AMP receptor protein
MNKNVSPQMFQLLLKLALFEGLVENELDLLLSRAMLDEYREGEFLMREDDESFYMFVILSGQVDIIKRAKGQQKTLVTLGPGKCLGEMSLIERCGRSASAVATTPCKLLRLNRDALNPMPEIAAKIYRNIALILSRRLRRTNEALTLG